MSSSVVRMFVFFVIGLAVLIAALSMRGAGSEAAGADHPVIIELFTSQSCSSCPPADRLLKQISDENPHVIALGCHVTYWDHLHWKDTYSRPFCTQRQRAYAGVMGSRRVYTPQMIVNGRDEFVGSNRGKVKTALRRAAAEPLKRIEIEEGLDGFEVSLPSLPEGDYVVSAFVTGDTAAVHMASGENRGRDVEYSDPVLQMIGLGHWDGRAKNLVIDKARVSNQQAAKALTVLVHQGSWGPIVAAGRVFDF